MLKLCVSKNPGQFDFSPLKMYKESIYKMLLTQLCKNHLATSSFCARCRPQHFFLIHVNQFCIALPCVPLEMLKRGFWNYISTYWPQDVIKTHSAAPFSMEQKTLRPRWAAPRLMQRRTLMGLVVDGAFFCGHWFWLGTWVNLYHLCSQSAVNT